MCKGMPKLYPFFLPNEHNPTKMFWSKHHMLHGCQKRQKFRIFAEQTGKPNRVFFRVSLYSVIPLSDSLVIEKQNLCLHTAICGQRLRIYHFQCSFGPLWCSWEAANPIFRPWGWSPNIGMQDCPKWLFDGHQMDPQILQIILKNLNLICQQVCALCERCLAKSQKPNWIGLHGKNRINSCFAQRRTSEFTEGLQTKCPLKAFHGLGKRWNKERSLSIQEVF